MKRKAGRKMEFQQVQLGKTSLKTGFARIAVQEKKILKWSSCKKVSVGWASAQQIILGSVDIALSEALSPATCCQDPAILINKQNFCNESEEQHARKR